MDPIDGFYHALDSEQPLRRLGPQLLVDAQQLIAVNPDARVAGLIALPDSAEAETLRRLLVGGSSHPLPSGQMMVGIVPRAAVEGLLTSRCGDVDWREEAWHDQQVLPVVVSTKDGFRFGFFALGDRDHGEAKPE